MRRDSGLFFFALLWLGFSSPAPAATFTVTNTANSGAGSLRQAVIDANASPGADTINVNATGTVTLSTSLPALTGDIDLNGPASGSFTVTGGASVAIFAGAAAVGKSAAGTVVLSAASSNTGGTRVSGGVLQGSTTSLQGDIANNANVTLSQTTTGTYAGNMSGTGSLTKAGTGTVTLSGTNTYSGGTTISAGTLQGDTTSLQGNIVDNATVNFNQTTAGTYTGNISGTGAIVKQGAGTLTLTGTNTNTGTTTVSAGTLQGNTANLRNNITNNAAIIFDQGSAGTYSGAMSGTGSLTKQGAGTLTLTGANTYSGGTTVSAGTLQGSVTAVRGNITNNAAVVFDQPTSATYSGVMSGSGSLTKQGAGTLTLSGANTYSGGTTVSAGALQGSTTNLQGNITNDASVIFNQGSAGTYSGVMSGAGSLTKSGTGTLTLTGANTYSGGTTISAGTLQGDTTSLQGNIVDNATVNFNQATAGTYTANISGTGAIVKQGAGTLTLTGTNTNTGTTTVSAGTLQGSTANLRNNITNNAAVVFDQGSAGTYSGVMSGTGSLTKQGAGTLTLTGANTYSGGTTVSAGTLQGTVTAVRGNIANDATVVFDQTAAGTYSGAMTGSGTLVKQGAGTLTLSGANTYSGGTTVSAGALQGTTTSLQGNITNNANVTISQTTAGTYAGAISGTGSLTKAGTGTVTLSGANTYSGGTTISAGTLQGDTTSLQGNIVDNATVNFNQATAGTYTGNISGTGAIVKQGAGTLTLTGTNTNTGTTTVSAGTLQGNTANLRNNITNNAAVVFDQGSAGTYSGVMSGTGSLTKQGAGTLTLTGANTYSGGTTVSAGTLQGTVTAVRGNIANDATVVFDQTAAGTYSGVMTGSGALVKQGAGTLTLSGANTYSGGTTVSAGTLQGTTTSLQGNITNNANVTISQTTAGTYAGAISGTGSLTKAGSGTVTLSGANTYSGGTTISAGTLQGDTTSLQGNIVDNATVNFNQTAAGTYAGNISGTGAIVKQGAGTLTLTGTNTNTGTTTVSAGTLQGNTANLRNNITNNAAVVFDQGSAGTYSGVMSGTGSLTKQGAGTLTLTGANTYSGGTTVSAGTLQGSVTAVRGNITNNAAVVFNQPTSATYSGVMTGSGSLTKQGAGTLTLSGANTYSGGTTVSAGALQGTTTSLQGNIANNANVTFNQTTTGTHSGNISGTGSLTKSGSGTVTLSGTNSYSGGTTVSAGTLQGNSDSLQGNIVDNATLRFNQTTDGTYAGNISGSGQLSKQGAGRLNLTGNVSVAGQTTVSAGNLAVNGALSGPVQVQAAGTLSGNGSVGAVVNQGTIAPGNSIGTLTVNGNYQQAASGTYQVEVNSAGQSDLLAVSGTAALAGAVDVVAEPGSYVAGTSFTILTAGGVSGQFSVLNYNFLNMQPMLVYESNLVRIVLVRPPTHFAAIADTFNQRSVGTELDALNPLATGQMAFTIDQLVALSPAGQRIGLDQLSGELHATAATVALDNTGYLLQLVSDRIRLGPLPEDGCGDGRSESRWRTWFLGVGQGGLLHSDGNAGLVNYTFAATTLGVETTLDEGLRAGVWLAYGPAAANRNGDRLDLDTGYAGLYGVRQIGPSYLMGTVSYWHGDFSTRRHIAFGDVAEAPRASYGGDGLAAYLEQGYAFDFGDWSVRPLIGLQYMNLAQSGYHEHGGGELDLIGPGRSLDSLRSVCGARLVRSLGPASACTLLELRARWTHEFFDQAPGITQLFDAPGATPFNIRGLTPSQDALLLGAGLRVPVSQRADVFFGYDANLATRQTAHGGNVGFQVVW